MKIGAELLIQQWGRPMEYYRNGVKLFGFKGRIVHPKQFSEEFDYSADQAHLQIIAAISDFVTSSTNIRVAPVKFDMVRYQGEDYTVQRGYAAGADEDELVKLDVIGGHI